MNEEELKAFIEKQNAEKMQVAVKEAVKTSIDEVIAPLKEEQNKFMDGIKNTPSTPEEKMTKVDEDVGKIFRAVAFAGNETKNRKAIDDLFAEGIAQPLDFYESTKGKQLTGVGSLIPVEYSKKVWTLLENYGVARRNCTIIPMSSNTLRNPQFLTQLQMAFVGTDHVKSCVSGEFSHEDLICRKIAGVIPMHDQDLADATINIAAFLKPQLANALAYREDRTLFLGNTTPGINGLYQAATIYRPGIAAITSLTADHLLELTEAVIDAGVDNERCKFYMSRSVFNIVRTLKTTPTGEYVYQKPSEKTPGTVWDYPYEIVSASILPGRGTSASGDPAFVYFGDLKYYLIGDRESLSFETSTEATITCGENIYNLFQMDMSAIRAVSREGFLPIFPAFSQLRLDLTSS